MPTRGQDIPARTVLRVVMIVVLAVLALNFLGDGLRDAADPYAQEGR